MTTILKTTSNTLTKALSSLQNIPRGRRFQGKLEREWHMDSLIRYIKVRFRAGALLFRVCAAKVASIQWSAARDMLK